MEDLNIIVKMKFGSHLYGTNTEESDLDYKGVFMPSLEQIFLSRIPKSTSFNTKRDRDAKNTSEDTDIEIYSLHYFIKLACQGETVAIDILHAPDKMIIESSDTWRKIVQNRHLFYTKNLKAFVGYARRQASKYGIKGSRLNDAKRVVDFLGKISKAASSLRLSVWWDDLPEGEHIFKHEINDTFGVRMYEVCGRKIPETSSLEYAYDIVNKFYRSYGERAKQAANNKGIDWKAVSHALRAAYQIEQIFTKGTITFPLSHASFLRDVKQGKYDFQTEIAPLLDSMIERVEQLALESNLPEKVNRELWNNFVIAETLKSIKERKQNDSF